MQKGKLSGKGDKMIDLKTARGEIDRIDEIGRASCRERV